MKYLWSRSGLLFIMSFFLYSEVYTGDRSFTKKIDGFPFFVYQNSALMTYNHFIPSGYMGDYSDLCLNGLYTKNTKTGRYCIQIKYKAQARQQYGWAGIYWQNPAHNWGGINAGYDLSGAKKCYFYARGAKGNECVEFKIGGLKGRFPDSVQECSTGIISLMTNWQLYEIDLQDCDLQRVIGGFCVVFCKSLNQEGCTVFLDDIHYTDTYKKEIKDKQGHVLMVNHNPQKKKVAVLNFYNISKASDLRYVNKLITELIITYLNRQKNLLVYNSHSLQDRINDEALIIDNLNTLSENELMSYVLNIDYIIKGSFIEENNQIRIKMDLVDVPSGRIIASQQIRSFIGKDIFLLLDKSSRHLLSCIEENGARHTF